jgi:hypothetical protein
MSLLANHGILRSLTAGYDADAQAFIDQIQNVEGITLSSTIQDAINDAVVSLKAFSIWSKCDAIYPFVGADEDSHKYNLKDPRDLDAAYRIVWNASVPANHTPTKGFDAQSGVLYGTTKYNASIHNRNDFHQGAYFNTFAENSGTDMGVLAGNNVWVRAGFGGYNCTLGGNALTVSPSGNATGAGFCLDYSSGGNHYGFLDTVSMTPIAITSGTLPNDTNYQVGRLGNFGQASGRYFKWATMGAGLTTTEAADYKTVVNAFQVALSRDDH